MKGSGLTVATAATLFAPIEASLNPHVPKATASVDLAEDGWTPKPTPPPSSMGRLRRRQSDEDQEANEDLNSAYFAPDNVCGYVDGRPGAPFSCSTDYNCVLFPASSTYYGYVGCCDDINCGVRFDCIDYEGFYSSTLCGDACQLDVYTLKCTDSRLPYCNTISFSSDILDYWCNSMDMSDVQFATTEYSGEPRSFELVTLSDEEESFTLTGETSGAGATVTVEPSATDSSGDDEESGDSDDGGDGGDDSGTPVGAIVGGVVGGVGAIGLGGLGLWLFFRNKKKKQAAAAAAQPSPSVAYAPVQQQGPPPPGMAPSPGAPAPDQPYQQNYYDPKFVAAGQTYQPYPQQQPGGFYPMGNTPPPPQSTSPSMGYADPNSTSSPSAAYPSGISAHSPPSQQGPQQGGFVAEAPSRPEETHRGGVHELA